MLSHTGRYFACCTHAIAVNVISKKCVSSDDSSSFMYYVNDGVYGSFNGVMYEKAAPVPTVLSVSLFSFSERDCSLSAASTGTC